MILPCFLGLGSEKEIQVGLGVQKLISRKRLRPNNVEQTETSSAESIEIDEHPKEKNSESDTNIGSELPDIMGGIEKAFDHIHKMRKRYLEAFKNMMNLRKKTKKIINKII